MSQSPATVASKQSKLDVEADVKPVVQPSDITVIVSLAKEMYKLSLEIAQLEESAAEKQTRFNALRMTVLPERMEACGLTSFSLNNGYVIDVKDFVNVSIPTETAVEKAEGPEREALAARRKAALTWLRANKAGDLIKSKLVAEFGKGEEKNARKFFAAIEKAGYPATCEEAVNYQTLKSFIKEQLANGVNVPSEPFALFIGKEASIKKQKTEPK